MYVLGLFMFSDLSKIIICVYVNRWKKKSANLYIWTRDSLTLQMLRYVGGQGGVGLGMSRVRRVEHSDFYTPHFHVSPHPEQLGTTTGPLPHSLPRMVDLCPKCVWLAPNCTNSGLFQIRFQYILALWNKQNVLKYDMIESRIFPFFGQSNLKFL